MYRGVEFKEADEKTINAANWEKIYLDLTIISGYLKITSATNVKDKVVVKILSSSETGFTKSYNIDIDDAKEKIEIITKTHGIVFEVFVPKDKVLVINSVIKKGASNIKIDGETLLKLELSIIDGFALVKINNLGLSRIIIRNSDAATSAEFSYKYFTGRSRSSMNVWVECLTLRHMWIKKRNYQ